MPGEFACNWIDDHKDELENVSMAIWNNPEVGLREHVSSGLLITELQNHCFEVETGVAGMPTAFVAKWGHGKQKIAYLADMML